MDYECPNCENLEKKVKQFNALQLPGQQISMHMGTFYLVNDLWQEVKRLHKELMERMQNEKR